MAHEHSQPGNVDFDGRPELVEHRHPLAMVYGGGGVFGIAYTSGVATGLAETGIAVATAPSSNSRNAAWHPGTPDRLGALGQKPNRAHQRSGEKESSGEAEDHGRQIIDILMRRRQNNPILTGEAGVESVLAIEDHRRHERGALRDPEAAAAG